MVFPNLWSFLRKSLRLAGNGNLFLFDILILKTSVEISQVNLFPMFSKQPRNFYCKGSNGMQDHSVTLPWKEHRNLARTKSQSCNKPGITQIQITLTTLILCWNVPALFYCLCTCFSWFEIIDSQSSGTRSCISFRHEQRSYLHSDLGRFPCENKLADSNPHDYKVANLNGPHTWTSSFH